MSYRYFPSNYYGYFFHIKNFLIFLFGISLSFLLLASIKTKNSKQLATNNFMMTEVLQNSLIPVTKKFNKMNLDNVHLH